MILSRGIIILGSVAILSVMVNLFLAGNLFGLHFRGAPPPPMEFERRLTDMWRDMPQADQPVAKAIVAKHHDLIMEKLGALRPSNRAAGGVVRAGSFDAEAARRAFDDTNQRLTEFRTAIQDTVIEIASKISPEGRKHLRVRGGGF